MAQFDPLIVSTLVWSLTIVLVMHYVVSVDVLVPSFFGSRKFGEKKLNSPVSYTTFKRPILLKSKGGIT